MPKSAFSPSLQNNHSFSKYPLERKIFQSVPWEMGSQVAMFFPPRNVLGCSAASGPVLPSSWEPQICWGRESDGGVCWCLVFNYLEKSFLCPFEHSISPISVPVWGTDKIHSSHKYLLSLHYMPGAVMVLGIYQQTKQNPKSPPLESFYSSGREKQYTKT